MNEKPERWKRKSSRQLADCRVFQVRQDNCESQIDQRPGTFYVIENPDWVNVIALTPQREVVLIEQFRHGTEEIILEIPGGMMDENESAERSARRELLEETGFSSKEFIFLGKSRPNPAIQNNWIYHFLALNCEKTDDVKFDEHESVITSLVSLTKVKSLILNGKISHALVVAAFYFLEFNKNYEN